MLFIYIHASFMLAGFILMFAGMITARYLKKRLWWLVLHKLFGITGVCCLLLGISLISIHLHLINAGHLNISHAYLGVFIALVSVITPVMGYMQLKIHRITQKIKPVHRLSGRFVIVLMGVNIVSGLYLTGLV